MKKFILALSILSVLAACNGTGSSDPAVVSDSTQVADSTAPVVDTTVNVTVDTLK